MRFPSGNVINRREFTKWLVAGSTMGRCTISPSTAATAPTTIRVAAVQMAAELANVAANLAKAERLVRAAFARGARLVILPEFFTSGMAFDPEMAKAVRAFDGPPAQLLRDLARQGNAIVGGSFLAWRDGNVYNSFVLALPDGGTRRHDKDHPTLWENCYYVGGNDDGVLPTPLGNLGAALCWEFIRSKTAARLKGKVGMVVGGSCWWTVRDSVPADDSYRKQNLEILKATPSRFARMLGVPVVHAAHAGTFVGRTWPEEETAYPSHYLGETQIVDGKGVILARMAREEGEGLITADISFGRTADEPEAIPDRNWIAEYPEGTYRRWEGQLKPGHEYYVSTTLPHVKARFDRPGVQK
jgi:predicted amidohydrolase